MTGTIGPTPEPPEPEVALRVVEPPPTERCDAAEDEDEEEDDDERELLDEEWDGLDRLGLA
jgi:hypothetical protein